MLPVIGILIVIGAIGAGTYSQDASGKMLPKKTMAEMHPIQSAEYHPARELPTEPIAPPAPTPPEAPAAPIEPQRPVDAIDRDGHNPLDRIQYIEDIRRMHFYPSQQQPVKEEPSEQDSNATPPGASITKTE